LATIKKLFQPIQLNNTGNILYTTPLNSKTLIRKIIVFNTDITLSHTVTFYLVPSGGVAENTNAVCKATIEPSDFIVLEFEQVIEVGDTIQAVADASDVLTVHGTGIEGVY